MKDGVESGGAGQARTQELPWATPWSWNQHQPHGSCEVRRAQVWWASNQVAALPSGSDVVDWLYHNVEGFTDRREARKYASNLLKAGFIRHTVNKITFSEQCYYIFGDLCGSTCLPNLLALSPS